MFVVYCVVVVDVVVCHAARERHEVAGTQISEEEVVWCSVVRCSWSAAGTAPRHEASAVTLDS